MILSFLTMYRSAKKSTFITFVASQFPAPTLVVCSWLSKKRAVGLGSPARHVHLTSPCQQQPPKVIKYAACFSNMAQFPGRVKTLKQ